MSHLRILTLILALTALLTAHANTKSNDPEDLWRMGFKYEYGDGVQQNYAEAAKWYRKAAEQGDAEAQLNLGNAYFTGQGVKQDAAEAAKWYRKAADQGDPIAQNNLGICYEESSNYPQAMYWYKKAADKGYKDARDFYNDLYERGYRAATSPIK